VEVYSIGFTKKSAQDFFGILKQHKIRRILDVRLNNVSQLAGFAKKDDLRFFLHEICGAAYEHEPLLAPTQQMLDQYKKEKGSWQAYEEAFLNLMNERQIQDRIDHASFQEPTVLLCSEPQPDHCHRRLVLEYLSRAWGGLTIRHLF
jgi:uncharacterized protein (DUF488 family)